MEPKKRRILGFALLILLVLVFLLWNQVLPDMFPERAKKRTRLFCRQPAWRMQLPCRYPKERS